MGIKHKLTHWQDAGLITQDQAQEIAAYEAAHKGGRFIKGLIAAALFAILCGVLSIIAANWMEIPASVKLSAHGLINAAVAYGVWRAVSPLRREGLCLLLFGLTLTFIVLIGQVFQLGGGWANALVLWLVITAPMMVFFSETRITALPWMLSFLLTVCIVMEEYLPLLPEPWDIWVSAGIWSLLPLALIADGRFSFVRRLKPVWSDVFIRTGFVLMLLLACASSLIWYNGFFLSAASFGIDDHAARLGLTLIALIAVSVQLAYAYLASFYQNDESERAGAYIALLATLFMAAPVLLALPGGAVFASLHVIILWLLVGWIAQGQGWHRVVSLSILIITIRIFIIYCELFGDLLTTGLGLITGGVVMLALLWGAQKLNRKLRVS